MYPVKTATAVTSKPAYTEGGLPGFFTAGNPVAGIPATVPGEHWFNMTQEELLNVIRAAGLIPSATNDTQLCQAVAALILAAVAGHNESGTAHADIRAALAALGGSRVETLWLGAGAMIPRKANGATAGTDQSTSYLLMSDYLDFGADINRAAQAVFHLPGNWDRGSIKAKVHWMPAVAGATAGQYVGWAILCGAVGDGDVVDRSLGTGVIVDDQVLAGLGAVEHVTSASADITVSGEPQIGDRLQLVVVRQPAYTGGGTALPVAARLLGIEIQYTVTGNAAAWS